MSNYFSLISGLFLTSCSMIGIGVSLYKGLSLFYVGFGFLGVYYGLKWIIDGFNEK